MPKSQKCLFGLSAADLDEILRRSEKEWPGLKGRRLFLSGGTGFFGKWLLAALAHANDELSLNSHVTVLSRDPAHFLKNHPEAADFHFIRGDVTAFIPGTERYDFILHNAADTVAIMAGAQEEERSRVIVEGTRCMLALSRASGARLLHASSGGVYGAASAKLTGAREDDPALPITPYGRAKLQAEQLCLESGGDFVTARAFAFIGPHLALDAHYAAGNFLRDAMARGPIVVRGDGTALRSYLYPSDLVTWLLRLLLRGQPGRTYNVGSDEVVSTAELARRIAAACPQTPEVQIQSAVPQGPQNIYLPDIHRAREELGLSIHVGLDEAIRRSLSFLGR